MTRLARRSFCLSLACAASASALGRTPLAGSLRLRLPLGFGGLDPHALDDPLSALFAPAIADALYALDVAGKPYPTLASALPEHVPNGARLALRPELVSARGKALDARDVLFSLERSRGAGGASVLGSFAPAIRDPKDPLALVVPDANPEALARALASSLTAIVPRGFSALAPDGTGAFKAVLGGGAWTLTRNDKAARAPAFLDRIELGRAGDLGDALRAFEANLSDVGFLGNGLYRPKAGAVPLEGPVYGWMVLRTGLDSKAWGAPGIARQLTGGLPGPALARFGLRAPPATPDAVRWGGGPSALLVSDDSPYLLELGRALEPLLSSPGNEIRTTPMPRAAWLEARRSRRFALMLDFVRQPSGDATQAAQALLAAVDPALARRPPRTLGSLQDVTRTLPLGIVGEARITGARNPDVQGLDAWQLGGVWLSPKT